MAVLSDRVDLEVGVSSRLRLECDQAVPAREGCVCWRSRRDEVRQQRQQRYYAMSKGTECRENRIFAIPCREIACRFHSPPLARLLLSECCRQARAVFSYCYRQES